jgi:hypothetical protein
MSKKSPKKVYYRAIADFYIAGFREVKEGEFITISPDDIRDLGLADKVLQEIRGDR